MHESAKPVRVAYWNMLFNAPVTEQMRYLEELGHVASTILLTECPAETAKILKYDYEYVDVDERMSFKGRRYGMVVLSQDEVDVKRSTPWPAINYTGPLGEYRDHRDVVRVKVPHGRLGDIAVYGAHISHPHYIWRPRINMRRGQEWRAHARLLAEEELPFLWMADTNTFLASTVSERLRLAETDAKLLQHVSGPTWGPGMLAPSKMLYLDRVAASGELAEHTTLHTLPHNLNGVRCPSDHRPVLAVVS
jgi:hypothetical protein